MSYIILTSFYFIILIKSIINQQIPNCKLNSYCGPEKKRCSIYGICNYQLNPATLQYNIGCECNKGYSSFGINPDDSESTYCCYQQKSLLISFLLELFLGFGIGHFYMNDITYAIIKMIIQLIFCSGVGCVTYFSCIREHPFQPNLIEVNNNENNENNENKDNKENKNNENNENKDNKENKENENNGEKNVGDLIDNKNNESKDESFELEENKENERLFQEFISCPKTRVFIYFSLISFFTFNFIDAILIAFRLFKDNNGEELYIN